jgi:hypothetical protein
MLTRADVERITENVLTELHIEVNNGDFTNPNSRKIILLYRDRIISTAYFDVVQQREYEG